MRVIMMAAMTLCGKISPGVMGSSEDRKLLEEMRERTGASLLGAGTLRQGDAEMRGPKGVIIPGRIRALVTMSGEIPVDTRNIFRKGPQPLLFAPIGVAGKLEERLKGVAHVVAVEPEGQVLPLAVVLEELKQRGVTSVLLEGGGRLNYLALAQGVVDEILVTLTPKISGDATATSLAHGPRPLGEPFLELTLLDLKRLSTGEVVLRYQVRSQDEVKR